jgi:hypothetical protein
MALLGNPALIIVIGAPLCALIPRDSGTRVVDGNDDGSTRLTANARSVVSLDHIIFSVKGLPAGAARGMLATQPQEPHKFPNCTTFWIRRVQENGDAPR